MSATARLSAELLLVTAGVVVLGYLLSRLWSALLPVVLALLLTTVLWPVAHFLRRHSWPPALAALTVVVLFLAALAGVAPRARCGSSPRAPTRSSRGPRGWVWSRWSIRSGGGRGAQVARELARELPAAQVVVLGPGEDLMGALRGAAARAEVLGVGGGDGSVNAAARVALETGLPLLVLPGGTFNHFAADAGLGRPADAIAALRAGTAIRVDLGAIDGTGSGTGSDSGSGPISGPISGGGVGGDRIFLNTASLGSYPSFLAVRERWESRLGKRAAAVLALLVVARTERPLRAVVAGRELLVAMMFVGNGRYQPHGFAPAWRPCLDDGVLDVRLVLAGRRFAVLRLAASLALGRLGRSRRYIEGGPPSLPVSLPDGPGLLACDGEVGLGATRLRFHVLRQSLTVYRPQRRTFFWPFP